jgi:hypothetical protein
MLLAAVNALFAMGALAIAMQAARKGLPFIRYGWTLLQIATSHPDYRVNVERRREVSEGGRFLLGGVFWLVVMVGMVIAALYFGGIALRMLYNF